MSGHVLDTVLVGVIVAGAVTFLLRRAWSRARSARASSACGSCTGCACGAPENTRPQR